jgi:hypothetical protein
MIHTHNHLGFFPLTLVVSVELAQFSSVVLVLVPLPVHADAYS